MARFIKKQGRYEIKFKRGGKTRKHSVEGNTSMRALSALQAQMNEAFSSLAWNLELQSWAEYVRYGRPVDSSQDAATLGVYLEHFKSRFSQQIMSSSYGQYVAVMQAFLAGARLTNRPANKLDNAELLELFEAHTLGRSAATVSHRLSIINKFLAYVSDQAGVELQLRRRRSFDMRRIYSQQTISPVRYISHQSLLQVLEHTHEVGYKPIAKLRWPAKRFHALANAAYVVLFHQAMRWVELERLRPLDVKFEAGTMRLCGKGEKPRIVPIRADAAAGLRAIHAELESNPDVFGLIGYERFKKLFEHVMRNQLGYTGRVGLHMLRHGGATFMLSNGFPLTELSVFMGHTSIQQTQAYAKIVNQRLQDVVRNFDQQITRGTFGGLRKVK